MDRNLFSQTWDSSNGTAIRNPDWPDGPRYIAKPLAAKVKHKPTEAEDNAAGRKIRRRLNKALKGWRPHAKR